MIYIHFCFLISFTILLSEYFEPHQLDTLLLLFLSHHLELVHLLQLGDLECSLGLGVKLLTEDNTRPVVQRLAEGGEVILAHGGDIGEGSNLFENSIRNTHLEFRSKLTEDKCNPSDKE